MTPTIIKDKSEETVYVSRGALGTTHRVALSIRGEKIHIALANEPVQLKTFDEFEDMLRPTVDSPVEPIEPDLRIAK